MKISFFKHVISASYHVEACVSQQMSGDFLQWLQTFLLVAETGNIHRAAALGCISPSAASLHIRKLEQDLGIDLFVRKNKGMALTQAGHQFRDSSVPIKEAIELLRSGKGSDNLLRGAVRITCLNRLAYNIMPHVLEFKKLHPNVSFFIEPTTSLRALRNVEEGHFDFSVGMHRQLPGHMEFAALCPSSAFLYTPSGNPFNLPPVPSWEQICTLPFVSVTIEGYVNPIIAHVPDIRQPENIIVAVNDFILALRLVKDGIGVCISPPLTRFEEPKDYTVFNIDHIFPIGTLGIMTRRNTYLSPQAKAFMRYTLECYK